MLLRDFASRVHRARSARGAARSRVILALLAATIAVTSVLAAIPRSTQAVDTLTPLSPIAASADTGEKPQSKVFTYNSQWWAVIPKSSVPAGTWLWRLDGTSWTPVLQLSSNPSGHADVKLAGNVAHVLVYGSPSQLVSIEYVSGAWVLWAARPTPTSISMPAGHETMTMDIDSTGRMWLASDATTDIVGYFSDSPYSAFSGPSLIASGVSSDDISAVIALPGKIGVFWSNQSTQRFGFKVHNDGDSPGVWSGDEKPAADSALPVGLGMADDHMNLKVASDGTLYAAVKTSYDTAGYPKIALLIRRPTGIWDPLYEVDQAGTRPIMLLNESANLLRIAYTTAEGFNSIVYKETSLSAISFGAQQPLIGGGVNNATSTKQNWTDEFVVLASDASNNAQGVLVSVAPATATPTTTATGTATSTATPTSTPDPCGADGLVAVWGAEEASGATMFDGSVPPAHDATLSGNATRVTPGQAGAQALSLDGTDDYATTPDEACLDITGALTLATWVKPGRATTTDLLKKATNGSVNGYELGLSASTAPVSQKVFFRANQQASGDTYRVNSTTTYPSSGTMWIHVAGTYDGTNMRMYVNGVLEATIAGPASIAANALPFSIGAESNATRELLGQMDDMRVYRRALSGAEISVLAGLTPTATPTSAGTNTPTPTPTVDPCHVNGLVALWDMEVPGGPVLLDSAASPNDAALFDRARQVPVGRVGSQMLWLDGFAPIDYASTPDDTCLDITSTITLAAWIMPGGGAYATQNVIKKAVNSSANGYELSLSAAGLPFFRLNQRSNGDTYRVNATSNYPTDGTTWMHVAGTYDGANLRIYINGTLEATVAGVTTIASNTLPLTLGAQSDGTSFAMTGGIDDARVYNRALSGAEILALANPTSNTPTPTPTDVPTDTPEPTATPTDTPVPTATPTDTPEPTATPTDTPEPTYTPTDTPEPTFTPTSTPAGCGGGGLVAHYDMEEASGPLLDPQWPPNDATLQGNATRVSPGKTGARALDLDGTGDYATAPDDPCLDITDELTLAAWVKPQRRATQDIVKKAAIDSVNGYELTLATSAGSPCPEKPFFRLNQVTSSNTYRVSGTTVYPIDGSTWVHLAGTYDGTTMRLYVNGALQASIAGPASIATNSLALSIGAQADGQRTLQGHVDDVRVYDRALSDVEVAVLAGLSGAPTPTPTTTPEPQCFTPTATPTPTDTPIPTATPTDTAEPTATPTDTPVPTATPTDTPVPTATPTDTPVPTATPTDTPEPTATPTATATAITCGADVDCDGFDDLVSTSHQGPANTNVAEDNCAGVANPTQANHDGNFVDLPPSKAYDDVTWPRSDAQGDACDPDDDNDGIPDAVEEAGAPCASASSATDPLMWDTDGDRATDGAECAYGTDPANASSKPGASTCHSAGDTDADGVVDARERCFYSTSASSTDSDGDGRADGCEIASINGDTFVSVIDLQQIAVTFPPAAYIAGIDVNKDGAINVMDLQFVAQRMTVCP